MRPDQESGDLRTLLGLPPDAATSLVRSTYEQHMSAAVRSGNHRRAVQLSRAFDDQPLVDRRSLYSGAGSLAPRFADDAATASARPRRRGRRAGRRRRVATRVAVYAVVIPVAVVVGVAAVLHLGPSVSDRSTSPTRPAPEVRLQVTPTAAGGSWWQVPTDAPVDADGRVAVWCHDGAGNGTTSRLVPGQTFTCPAGQVAAIGER